ncbi:hypothetical protein [Bacillus coahuilensis]|nr:hypothetical protein [Bacillus coahuilensis]
MMPSEMPQTGMGGTANSASSNLWVYALIGGVAITSIIGLRRFQKNN